MFTVTEGKMLGNCKSYTNRIPCIYSHSSYKSCLAVDTSTLAFNCDELVNIVSQRSNINPILFTRSENLTFLFSSRFEQNRDTTVTTNLYCHSFKMLKTVMWHPIWKCEHVQFRSIN
jgi:hypothetical protein